MTDPAKLRRYCWRTGKVFVFAAGEKCPECGATKHTELVDQSSCGVFVATGDGTRARWGLCGLVPDHKGAHKLSVKRR